MAANAVQVYGLPRDVDPQTALLEEVHRTAGHVAWLGEKVAAFAVDDDLKQRDQSGRFEKASVWLDIYQSERKHLTAVAKAAIDAGVAERQVRLAEEQGAVLADVLRNVLADVFGLLAASGLSVEVLGRVQRDEVPAVLRRRLSAVSEPAP